MHSRYNYYLHCAHELPLRQENITIICKLRKHPLQQLLHIILLLS